MIRIAIVALLSLLFLPLAAVMIAATTQPDSFRVERETTIAAPPEEIYAILSDFHRSGEWSPYEKLDPAMERGYEGAASGEGAVYTWSGNSDAGSGRLEIVEARPAEKLVMTLDFTEPFEAHNMVEYVLEPTGEGTRVIWAIYGPMPFASKVMCLFVSMDELMGEDFETGLANLKQLAES